MNHALERGGLPARAPYHLGLVTRDLEAAMKVLGVAWSTPRLSAEAGLASPAGPLDWTLRSVHHRSGAMGVELIEGSPGSTWATDELIALHHLAYWSDDVGDDVAALLAEGWSVEATFYDDRGRSREFAYLVRPGDTRIELVAASRRDAYLTSTADLHC